MSNLILIPFPIGVGESRKPRKPLDLPGRIARTLEVWRHRYETRRRFAEVDAHILRDIGVSEGDRFIEVNKPFWEE